MLKVKRLYGIYLILLFTAQLLVSCGGVHGSGDSVVADSLFNALSAGRYRNMARVERLAYALDSVSGGSGENGAVARNAMAYSALMGMDYARASELYGKVLAGAECEIERLVADVGMMTLCYRVSENRRFFDYRTSAQSRIERIEEELQYLPQGDLERYRRAKVEYEIVSVCYFSNLAMQSEKAAALEELSAGFNDISDVDLRLYARMLLANNEAVAADRVQALITGLNIAENRDAVWLRGNYRLLLAISLRDSAQLGYFAGRFPEKLGQLLPAGEPLEELPFRLASAAVDDFSKFGDRYMMIEAMAVHASCYTQNARFYEALALLDDALAQVKMYYCDFSPDTLGMCENPLLFLEEGGELQSDISSGLYNIPECLLSICREASCAYSGIGDKLASDINREAYLELLRTTRMNRELESRASTADADSARLRTPLTVSLLALVAVIVFLISVHRGRRGRGKLHSQDRKLLLGVCRSLITSIPDNLNTKEELFDVIEGVLNRELEGFSGETRFSLRGGSFEGCSLPHICRFDVVYLNGGSPDVLAVASSIPLTAEKRSIIATLVPYIAVAVEEGLRLAGMSDEREKVVEQRAAYAIYLAGHKRENLYKRVSLSVLSGMRPFMDRIINELRVIVPELPAEDKQRKLQYVAELTEKLDDMNLLLERWIKTRQGELNLRVENFALSGLFGIIEKRAGLFSSRGIELLVKGGDQTVKADKALTLFMVNTLVDNALKFTPAGGKVVLESCGHDGYVEISVTDSGAGMSQADIDRILGEKVYDASRIGEDNPALPAKSKGGGFGLMNCKGIIEKYRKSDPLFSVCSLDIKSRRGEGSRFSFRLPKGVVRMLLLLLISLPSFASAGTIVHGDDALFEKVNACADSVYASNVAGNYSESFVQAQSAIEHLNSFYRRNSGENDTLSLSGAGAAELRWWREGLFPDSLREKIYYNILDIRNELAVASLATQQWNMYRSNNYIYSTLYRLVHEDKEIARHYADAQRTVNMQYATIALSCFLLILLLLYYVVSYVRHNLIEYTNEHLAIEMNNRLLHVATGKQRRSAAELAQGFVNEIYECMGENLRLEGVYMLLGDGNGVEPVFAECSGGAVQQRADLYMLSAYDSGKDYVSANETERVLPLRTLTAAGHRAVGVLKIVTARPLSENEVLTLELVSGYLAAVAYHSAVLVESGYQAIDELEEEAERMKFEENRMHVQNMVMDNCLSVIKHETIYYPSRVRALVAKAMENPSQSLDTVNAMRELMDYYSSIFGILGNCAVRELDDSGFTLARVELNTLFGRMQRYVKRCAAKAGLDVRLQCEPVAFAVNADPDLVEFLFEALIDAALKDRAAGVLELRAHDDADAVTVELFDTRMVLPSGEAADLFTPSRRNLAPGNGVAGMEYLVAKEIVRLHEDYTGRHGCRMEARSDVSGTVIMFTLPK